jgi:hypothetical protein
MPPSGGMQWIIRSGWKQIANPSVAGVLGEYSLMRPQGNMVHIWDCDNQCSALFAGMGDTGDNLRYMLNDDGLESRREMFRI